jgi:hypothetical protein
MGFRIGWRRSSRRSWVNCCVIFVGAQGLAPLQCVCFLSKFLCKNPPNFLEFGGFNDRLRFWKGRFCQNALDISNAGLAKPAPTVQFRSIPRLHPRRVLHQGRRSWRIPRLHHPTFAARVFQLLWQSLVCLPCT